jgi:hypothetical protein
MTPPKDGVHPPSSVEIHHIRQDLDKRSAAEVARDEAAARRSVDRNARNEGERGSFLGQIFGGKK